MIPLSRDNKSRQTVVVPNRISSKEIRLLIAAPITFVIVFQTAQTIINIPVSLLHEEGDWDLASAYAVGWLCVIGLAFISLFVLYRIEQQYS